MYLPKEDPEWDPNTSEGLQRVKEYQKLILYGIQHGVQKPKNLSELYQVRQGDKETPSAFYERLCEVARKWTDLDPEDDSNSKLFNMLFIGQAAADIRKKLQKVEGADGVTISQLLSIAYKMPECPLPLLGWDLLCKLNAQLTFSEDSVQLHIPPETAWKAQICLLTEKDPNEEMNIPEEVLNAVIPLVWASKIPGQAKNATPVKTELKPGAQLVRKKQYPIKMEAQKGLEPIISSFLEHGLLQECQSAFNTPILPVKKPHSSEYRLVQDLREINARTVAVHPVVPNPYALLTTIPNSNTYFTVLDLKDAFFCIPVDEQSQTIFAFEWENPATGRKTQLCWTVLPQGFKNSPTLFGNVLAKELELWQNDHDAVTLLQYVDDLLIGSDSYEACLEATITLLNFLGLAGYRVSKKKAQIGKEKVQYMGFEITKGQRELSTERKEAICRIAVPTSKKQLRGFLGMARWCRLWIPNFGLIAKPLYAAVKGPEGVLEWTPECRKSFDEIKRKLMEAPALGLLNLRKLFQLYVRERQQVALGVLTQKLGSWKRPVGYFSKQLDEVSKGWPACLRAVAATATLTEESRKLTLGQPITVFVPHAVSSLLENKGHHWISPSRLAKYQAVLLEQDGGVISLTSALNPATLLPISESGELHHDCLTTIEQVYSSRPDLQDEPLPNAELELFTDGSSFMLEGRRKAGYAVVTRTRALEVSLPSNTSAQKAELVALTQALELSQGKRVNIYTDSKYAFGVVHAHGAIWKERGLLSSHGTPIKYGTEIMKLLQAVLQPKEVAIMHCKAHQKGNNEITKGNRKADQLAKEAALQKSKFEGALIPVPHLELSPPQYTEKENQLAGQLDCSKTDQGWWVTPLKQLLISEKMMEILLEKLHQETHSGAGADALVLIAKRHVIGPRMQSLADIIVKKHAIICCANNPKIAKKIMGGIVKQGITPGEYWQIDFTELPRCNCGRMVK
ncbi:hypothetical protein QYF61_013314 [Mycteria americana]|uniref:ribonuclease H n=1 Tax=Mycteria americana TaxID=33587 RepID=A0AAN7NGG8_MYCAM|nr:hypothetical protein QYF61_013314 [Mycteria americana]